jgi:chromate transport protein ChrA
LIIAALFKKFSQNKYIKSTLNGITPVVCGLILATGLLVAAKNLITNFGIWDSAPTFDFWSLAILAVVFAICFVFKKATKKTLSPILVILLSGAMGILIYSFN